MPLASHTGLTKRTRHALSLQLCDGAALRLPFGVTMSFAAVGTARFAIAQLVLQNHREHDMVPFGREHFVVLEHFVVALLADRARAENLGRAVPGKSFKYRNKSFIIVFCRPDGANG